MRKLRIILPITALVIIGITCVFRTTNRSYMEYPKELRERLTTKELSQLDDKLREDGRLNMSVLEISNDQGDIFDLYDYFGNTAHIQFSDVLSVTYNVTKEERESIDRLAKSIAGLDVVYEIVEPCEAGDVEVILQGQKYVYKDNGLFEVR